jgi:hypothetical protein
MLIVRADELTLNVIPVVLENTHAAREPVALAHGRELAGSRIKDMVVNTGEPDEHRF